jgi:hypothetical protein
MARTALKQAKRVVADSESEADSDASFARKKVNNIDPDSSFSSSAGSPAKRRPLGRLSDNHGLRRQSLTNVLARHSDAVPPSPSKQRIASGGRIAGLAAARAASSLSNSLNGGGQSLMAAGLEMDQPGVSKQGKNLGL